LRKEHLNSASKQESSPLVYDVITKGFFFFVFIPSTYSHVVHRIDYFFQILQEKIESLQKLNVEKSLSQKEKEFELTKRNEVQVVVF